MATIKQIAANRANALKSTGPRTPAGKQATSLNALRHGLTGQTIALHTDDIPAWLAFERKLTQAIDPVGAEEENLAARIVEDTWRLHRAAAHERNIYTLGLLEDAPLDHPNKDQLDPALLRSLTDTRSFMNRIRDVHIFSLYEQRLNRSLQKNYDLLRRLQRDRKAADDDADDDDAPSSRPSASPKRKIGLVWSTDGTEKGIWYRSATDTFTKIPRDPDETPLGDADSPPDDQKAA